MACADVTSGNVVGYSHLHLNAGGKNMVGPCFVNVTGKTIKLSDIKVTGYEDNEYYMWTQWSAPVVVVQRRETSGLPYAQYAWSSEFDGEAFSEGYWGKEFGDEDDPELKPGDALWVDTPDLEGSDEFSFVVSGEVVKGAVAFELNAGGKISVANPVPTPCTLADVEFHGYEDNEYYKWTQWSAPIVVIQKLMTSGLPEMQFAYSSEFDGESFSEGVWGKEIGDYEADEWVLKPGEGFWVDCPDLEGSDSFYLVFPEALPADKK